MIEPIKKEEIEWCVRRIEGRTVSLPEITPDNLKVIVDKINEIIKKGNEK